MSQEEAANKAVQTMIMKGILSEEDRGDAREIAMQIWAAGYEYHSKEMASHCANKKKVRYYSADHKLLGEYPSIREARNATHIPLNTISNTLYGITKTMRNGHYFRYADDEDNGRGNNGEG